MQETKSTIEISDSLKDVIQQLNEPQTASALKNLAKNARVLDLLVESLDGFLRRGEEISDNIGESIREFAPTQNGNGHKPQLMEEVPELLNNLPTLAKTGNKLSTVAETEEFDALLQPEKIAALKELTDQLANPETLDSLKKVVEYAPMMVFLIEGLDGFLKRGEEITDNIGESIREFTPKDTGGVGEAFAQMPQVLPSFIEKLPELAENLPPLVEQAPSLMKTGAKLGEIAESDGVQAFLESEMLSPELVEFLGETGKVAVDTRAEFEQNPKEVSVWGAYREMKDADVQRGLGFILALSKNLGKMMKK